MGEIKNVYKVLVGKSERKRPLLRPRRRWEGNIRMNLREPSGKLTGFIWPRIGTSGGFL
jgi:hypothetical protein